MRATILILVAVALCLGSALAQTEDPAYPNPILAPSTPLAVAGGETSPSGGGLTIGNAVGVEAGEAPAVIEVELDVRNPVQVPTSSVRTTTIVLPFPIDDLHGAGFTQNPKESRGDFLVSAKPGATYFSVTPLRDGVRRNLNVMSNGRCYSFDIYPAKPTGAAAFSVIVKAPSAAPIPNDSRKAAGAPFDPMLRQFNGQAPRDEPSDLVPAQRSLVPPPATGKPASPERLRGVLQTIKLLTGLSDEKQVGQVVAGMPDIVYKRRSGETIDAGNLRIELLGVARNDAIDAVGFAVRLTNITKGLLALDPASLAVRVGDPAAGPLYRSALSQAPANLSPGASELVFFTITGSADGARNRIAVLNRFSVSIDSKPAQKVATTKK